MRRSAPSTDLLLAILALATSVLAPAGVDADTWRQVNEPGFGNPDNRSVSAMALFDGYLYVATDNDATGSEIWKSRPGSWEWRPVTPPWSTATSRAEAMAVFNGHLYVGTDQGEIWRTAGEFVFTPCERIPFIPGCISKQPGGAIFLERWGEATPTSGSWRGTEVNSLAVFEGRLFLTASAPLEVWRSVDGLEWIPVVINDGFLDPENNHSGRLRVFRDHLYVATGREVVGGPGGPGDGLEIWRTADGIAWSAVVATDEPGALLPSGFGLPGNTGAPALTVFLDQLYVSTVNHVDGAQIWRFDGSAWEDVTPAEFAGPFGGVLRIQSLAVFGRRIFAGRGIGQPFPPVWSSRTGDVWGLANPSPEWPQENDTAVQAMAASSSALYVGTQNGTDGLSIIEKQPSRADRGLGAPDCLIPKLCGPPFPPFLTE
jgi:hypothetical protein